MTGVLSVSIRQVARPMTLSVGVESLSSDKDIATYWNSRCDQLQKHLWLPTETASSAAIGACKDKSHETPLNLGTWRRIVSTNDTCGPELLVRLTDRKPTPAGRQLIKTKVRIFPEREQGWYDLLRLSRRAYNLAVAAINNRQKPNLRELTRSVRAQLKEEFSTSVFVSVVADDSVREAFGTLTTCVRKWKSGERANLKFRSIKDERQSFPVQRCSKNGQIFPTHLGSCHVSEEVGYVRNQTVRVVWERGRWFVVYCRESALSENQAGGRPVAIDPGVRTFATVFSSIDVAKYGDGFQDVIRRLQDRLDSLISVRDKLKNLKTDAQWCRDRLRNVQKKIWKTSNRMRDLIADLHRRVAFDLVSKYDVLFLPTFETQKMATKKNRKIDKATTRRMLTMSFYKFGVFLGWMCKKYGKTLIRVNESYTSKTDSRTGEVVKNLGSSRTINGLDRDVNGARGIFLRATTRAACALTTSRDEKS